MTDDLYAVGVVGYEALAGHRPYTGDTILSLAHAIVHGHHEPLTAVRPDLDPALAAVIERALSRDTERRFASAAQMRNALENPRRIPPPATRVIGPVPAAADPPASAQPRRSPGAGVIVAAVTAMLVAIAAAALAVASQDEDSTAGSPSVLPTPASTPSPRLASVAPPTMTIRPEPVAPAPETVVPDYTTGGNQPIAGAGNGGGNGNQGNGNAHGNAGHGNGNGGRGNGRGGN